MLLASDPVMHLNLVQMSDRDGGFVRTRMQACIQESTGHYVPQNGIISGFTLLCRHEQGQLYN